VCGQFRFAELFEKFNDSPQPQVGTRNAICFKLGIFRSDSVPELGFKLFFTRSLISLVMFGFKCKVMFSRHNDAVEVARFLYENRLTFGQGRKAAESVFVSAAETHMQKLLFIGLRC